MISIAFLTDIAERHGEHVQTALDLITAANKMTVEITDQHLVDWKRGRGMRSSFDMGFKQKRARFIRFAREVLRDAAPYANTPQLDCRAVS